MKFCKEDHNHAEYKCIAPQKVEMGNFNWEEPLDKKPDNYWYLVVISHVINQNAAKMRILGLYKTLEEAKEKRWKVLTDPYSTPTSQPFIIKGQRVDDDN